MALNADLSAELNLLLQFNPGSLQAGLKVHHDAETALVEAAQRLFGKGLITQADGGYLTDLGAEAADHLRHLLGILSAS